MRNVRVAVAAVLLASSAAAPASAADRQHEQMMADIRMLQEQAQQLQLMLGTLAEAIKTVSARIDEQAGAMRKALADQKLQADTLSGDVRVLDPELADGNE